LTAAITLLVLGSYAIRIALVVDGGQLFFWDEQRYDESIQLYRAFLVHDRTALTSLLSYPEHSGFRYLGVAVTSLQHLLAQLTPYGDFQQPFNEWRTIKLAGVLLAGFSAANIWLVYQLARAADAPSAEAGWAALLMACSNTAFYFARHLLPYDAAIFMALASAIVGARFQSGRLSSVIAGGLAGATFHVYNGYWFLVPLLLAWHAFIRSSPVNRLKRLTYWAIGAGFSLALPLGIGCMAAGPSYLKSLVNFSRSITQGLFTEGWSLPWVYWAHSEGIPGLVVVTILLVALVQARLRNTEIPSRIKAWLALAVSIYATLVFFSVVLHKFTVYGRTVKPMIPFLCLAGGWALTRLVPAKSHWTGFAVGTFIVGAVIQFAPHFNRQFPREFENKVISTFGVPKRTLSFSGSIYAPLRLPVNRPDLLLTNMHQIYPIEAYIGVPPGDVLVSVPHPLSYLPYQYEAHSPRERNLLRQHVPAMQLIHLRDPETVPDDLRVSLTFDARHWPNGLDP